jgi:hypothetical protein
VRVEASVACERSRCVSVASMGRLAVLAVVVVAWSGRTVLADPPAGGSDRGDDSGAQPKLIPSNGKAPPPAPPSPPEDASDTRSHKGQLGLSARFALIGMSAIKPYNSGDYCGATSDGGNSALCLNRLPISLDLEPSFGVSRHTEVLVELRIGLEGDFGSTAQSNNGPHLFHVAPGIRYFFSEGRKSKLFTTAQAVFDFTNYENSAGTSRGVDIGIRNLNGLWFDLDRAYGFYVFVGETASFARWIRLDLEAGLGFQVRFL